MKIKTKFKITNGANKTRARKQTTHKNNRARTAASRDFSFIRGKTTHAKVPASAVAKRQIYYNSGVLRVCVYVVNARIRTQNRMTCMSYGQKTAFSFFENSITIIIKWSERKKKEVIKHATTVINRIIIKIKKKTTL